MFTSSMGPIPFKLFFVCTFYPFDYEDGEHVRCNILDGSNQEEQMVAENQPDIEFTKGTTHGYCNL